MLNDWYQSMMFIGLCLFLVGCGSSQTDDPVATSVENETLSVMAKGFEDGQLIPKKHTCDGKDVSPALTIEGVPEEAQRLAVLLEDPDAPGGTFDHWLLWNVSAEVKTLPGGITPETMVQLKGDARQGKNGFGTVGYRGPCPPEGETHEYVFTVLALGQPLNVAAGANKAALRSAMAGHVMASGQLTGTYGR